MSEPPVNLSLITDNFGDDHDFLHEVYTIYLRDTALCLTRLEKSIIEGNTDECSDFAHDIKGASANVGANRVAQIANELERNVKASDQEGIAGSMKTLQSEFDSAKNFLSEFIATLDV